MGIGKKILLKVVASLTMTGVMLYVDYKLNGDYSTIGILKRLREVEKEQKMKEGEEQIAYIVPQSEYQIV